MLKNLQINHFFFLTDKRHKTSLEMMKKGQKIDYLQSRDVIFEA